MLAARQVHGAYIWTSNTFVPTWSRVFPFFRASLCSFFSPPQPHPPFAMTAVVQLPYSLPPASSSHKVASPSAISAPSSSATLLPAGPSYIAHTRRQLGQLDFDADDDAEQARLEELRKADTIDGDDEDLPEEEESRDLLDRDPKEWKVRLALSG